MTKVLFIQELMFDYLGPMILTAFLKKNGHDSQILIESDPHKILAKVFDDKIDIVAFGVMTGSQDWVIWVARYLKKALPKLHVIVGGAHATFFPETIISEDCIDSVCVGEGEGALLDLANALQNKTPLDHIQNLWVKSNHVIIKNPLRPIIENLDILPFADRTHYFHYPQLKSTTWKSVSSGRGCPFNCSFCFNESYNKLYGFSHSQVIRKRSPKNICDEINSIKKLWPIEEVHFWDDAFNAKREWLEDLISEYTRYCDLPFRGDLRIDLVREKDIEGLKRAGCVKVMFGLESGNEELRKRILNKPITNKQIIEGAALLRKHKIKFGTFNVVGIPGETLENSFETIKLNQKIKTDFPWCSIAQPYPNTKLYRIACDLKVISQTTTNEFPISFFKKSILNQPQIKEMERVQKMFFIFVKYPFIFTSMRWIVYLPFAPLYFVLFSFSQLIRHKQFYSLSLTSVLIFCFNMSKSYLKTPLCSKVD